MIEKPDSKWPCLARAVSTAQTPGIHPLIGTGCIFAGAVLLPSLGFAELLKVSAALLLATWGVGAGPRCWRSVLRMRWLLAALALVYLAFTPGEPLFSAMPGFSGEGFVDGLRRALILIDIVAGVSMLLERTPTMMLACGLLTGLRPFNALGFDSSRLAVRIALTLDVVDDLAPRLRSAAAAGAPLAACAALVISIEREAQQPLNVEPLHALPPPPLWQWLLPVSLASGLWLLGG